MFGFLKRRRKTLVDNSRNPDLALVYTTSEGIEVYAHTNPVNISPLRGVAAETAKRFADMNLTKQTLRELLTAHRQAAMSNDISKCFAIVNEIEMRNELLGEETSLLDLGFLYCYLRDESPDRPNEYHTKLKREMCERDPDAKAFFLSMAWQLSQKLAKLQGHDLLSYLEQTREVIERVSHYSQAKKRSSSSDT